MLTVFFAELTDCATTLALNCPGKMHWEIIGRATGTPQLTGAQQSYHRAKLWVTRDFFS